MLLTARPLINVANVNTWEYADQVKFTQGDQVLVYFQLIDAIKDTSLKMPGKRYVAASGATLIATVNSIDINKTYAKVATQPFPGDLSIWQIQILASDQCVGTLTIKLALLESGLTTHGVIKNVLSIDPQSASFI